VGRRAIKEVQMARNSIGRPLRRRRVLARSAWALAAALLAAPVPTLAAPAVPTFDLGALPIYAPGRSGSSGHCHGAVCNGEWGVIRIQGSENFQELISGWQNAFLELHPNIRFSDYFMPSGIGGLVTETYDIGVLGHSAWRSDFEAFREAKGHDPLEIMFATGGFDEGKANTPAPVFIVSKENPLASLTLEQIDGIFGTERTGGWTRNFTWTKASARPSSGNIRTWGQLGLTGEWADKPIHLCGFDATLSNWSQLIEQVAFKGGDKWNPSIHEMVRGGMKAPADAQIVQAVVDDKYAIAFNIMRVVRKEPRLKVLPIAATTGGAPVTPSTQSIFRREYPLANAVYLYVDRKPGQPLPPRIKEFLTFVLSRQGQEEVARQGLFIPLNAEAARRELEKLH
jgi:phosphate transport system substrate-binding protein